MSNPELENGKKMRRTLWQSNDADSYEVVENGLHGPTLLVQAQSAEVHNNFKGLSCNRTAPDGN